MGNENATRQTDQNPHRQWYAARATTAQPADQHEHHRRPDDLGITGTSA
jgi:hypothetical protein